jgi:hypothetical protein
VARKKPGPSAQELRLKELEVQEQYVELEKIKHRRETGLALVAQFGAFINKLPAAAVFIIVALCCFWSVESIAGKTTWFEFAANLVEEGHFLTWLLPLGAALGGSGVALRALQLKGKSVEHLHDHNRQLENLYDPNRSSSNLTPTGETHPEDRL